MRLTTIVTIVIRIYSLVWFIEGIVQCITQIIESHDILSVTRASFTLYGLWFLWIIFAVVVFFLSQPIARIAVPPPNEQVNVGTLSRYDLYCFAFTFLGLYFFLSSIGDAINALHYYVVTNQANRQSAIQESRALYSLTRPLLTSLASVATLLLAPKFAHKLSAIPRPSFPPESEQAPKPS
ncbi:MAG TPA: hypothetical protein VGM54_02535 [Chthoniobacter sp.]|jgi:hypothetical protein